MLRLYNSQMRQRPCFGLTPRSRCAYFRRMPVISHRRGAARAPFHPGRTSSWLLCALLSAACNGKKAAEPAAPGPVQQPLAPAAPKQRLVILGFDGVDPRWLETYAREGKLPVLKRLMEANDGKSYHTLASTNPPQSPVAWTTFATGTLPGEHGIFDFIARTLNSSPSGLPVLLKVATTSFEVQPAGPPVARNLRSGVPFWQTLANQGVPVVALNVPYSFPPDPMRQGRMLSGLGVPDLRETNSTFTYAGTDVSDAQVARPPGGGVLVKLALAGGSARFELEGPSIPGGDGARMKLPVEIKPGAAGSNSMSVSIAGKSHPLSLQAWSDFIEVEFSAGGAHVRGILRLFPLEIGKQTRLFISPISFHPRDPYAPISHPRGFSAELADDIGHLYKTVGWDHDTSALNAEVLDEGAFLRDMEQIETDRKRMLMARLDHPDWQLLIWVSTAPDRASHMFYRLIDKQHPRYDAALAQRYGNAIEQEYQRMDKTVGEVLAHLKPDDTLLVLSDHGFHEYRRGLHVNQWLRSQGLLALKNGAKSAEHEFLIDVDWSKTKAYAVGTGQIYVNQKGRERDGIVEPADVPAVTKQIHDGLLALRDKERGDAMVVRNVYLASDVFRGGRGRDAPDMQMAFAENYRTSWETILGGVPKDLFADNDKKWSGDHAASDVAESAGILIANRPIAKADPGIVDLAPTAHAFFGKPLEPQYTGKPLLKP
jgi:predicted AlkP superfamily phosphohydrolase/phosphomutase